MEEEDYPNNPVIKYKEKRSYSYKIISEGKYPKPSICAYTEIQNKYKIPDGYEVKTTWGRGKKNTTIRCTINYYENKPLFRIYYGADFNDFVESKKSTSQAAGFFVKASNPESKTRISGPLLFGLQLKCVSSEREKKTKSTTLKLVQDVSASTLTKCANNLATNLLNSFQEQADNFYNKNDRVILKELDFSAGNQNYNVKFGEVDVDNLQKMQEQESIVCAIDEGRISQLSYRKLAAINHHLPREWAVSDCRKLINRKINNDIPISLINVHINNIADNEMEDITEEEVISEVTKSIGNGGYRKVKDILRYIVPHLINKGILNSLHPTINLRISGDGRNVGRKVKHVMITVAILDDREHLSHPDYHYTVILYPGTENYETLKCALELFLVELHDIKENGMIIENIHWNFELYLSSDWKFLSICLGFNAANSTYFCMWCLISKKQQSDLNTDYTICKSMENLKNNFKTYNGHIKPPLFDMIPLFNWIPDELHVMLQITDRLWSLVIYEIKASGYWDESVRNLVITEMASIGVKFNFWLDKNSKNWEYTSLMGDEKIKVLRSFNLAKFFTQSRALKIRKLWNDFYSLYLALRNPQTNSQKFKHDAKSWLILFLSPSKGKENTAGYVKGLYTPNEITPYIHTLVHHIPEFLENHQQWGLNSFSCAPVEKKNHLQVLTFFRKTLKDGGNNEASHSAIIEILEFENRQIYFNFNNIHNTVPKPQIINFN